MKLKELKPWVDAMEKRYPENQVMVQISEPAVGKTPCVEVECFTIDGDWDKGKVKIVPEVELIRKNDSRFSPMAMLHVMGENGRFVWKCPRCMNKLDKYDSFCRNCGQNVQKDN